VRHPLSKGGCGFVVVGPTRRMVYLDPPGPRRGARLSNANMVPEIVRGRDASRR